MGDRLAGPGRGPRAPGLACPRVRGARRGPMQRSGWACARGPRPRPVRSTVFGNVDNASTIGREEIFGPVLNVIAAADEQDAVEIANDTIYGLNASCSPTTSKVPVPSRVTSVGRRWPRCLPYGLRHGFRRVQA